MEDNNGSKYVILFIMILFLAPAIITAVTFFKSMGIQINLSLPVVLGIIGAVILIWIIATYNKFVRLNMKVKQAQGGIDVYLKKRFDLIPNLVETVKGYKEYEQNVLEEITKLRTDYETRNDQDIKESENLNNRFTRILVTLEKYPELKASEQFLMLQKNLSKVESELQAARRIYNSEVTEFNMVRFKFPSNIIGGLFGFKEKSLFEIEESERENINVNI